MYYASNANVQKYINIDRNIRICKAMDTILEFTVMQATNQI